MRAIDRADVSVVIPTTGRFELSRAVDSVIVQTMPPREVVVVVDHPLFPPAVKAEQIEALRAKGIQYLEIRTTGSGGGSIARNLGVQVASSSLIAFLDDDDEWFPGKLHTQVPLLLEQLSASDLVFAASALVGRDSSGEYIWPRYHPSEYRTIAEYLFCRRGLFQGDGIVQTSTLLVPRSLLLRHPFTPGLARHQDNDWVIRAMEEWKTRIVFCMEPLSVYNVAASSVSSGKSNILPSVQWIDSVRGLVSRRAYSAFLLTFVIQRMGRRDLLALPSVLRRAVFVGRPKGRDLAGGLVFLLTTRRLRAWLRSAASTARSRRSHN